MNALIQEIVDHPGSTLMVIGNLILIESLLSVDNAAVLATMVRKLPTRIERKKALKFGIFGAYLFRTICLLLATYLIRIWWLKAVGGLYLIYLLVEWWSTKRKKNGNEEHGKAEGRLYALTVGRLGAFWATVISVELMDAAFSMDNVFAAVAFSNNIIIILCGVFIGILAMRFVAQAFVKLMDLYPFLEGCAYTVIGLLGIKLSLSVLQHFDPDATLSKALDSNRADWLTSLVTICIFFVPVVTSLLFNFPRKKKASAHTEHDH